MSALRTLVKLASKPLAPPRPPLREADAIVVLGAPTAPDGSLTAIVEERVRLGCELYAMGLAPTLFVSGKGEAGPMAARAIELGVPASAITAEGGSRTTEENARYCAELLPGGASVWVVSQPFHLRRASYLFRREGLRPLPIADEDSIQFRVPRLGLRWASREYVAWVHAALRTLAAPVIR